MARKQSRMTLMGFKAAPELAALLNALPNKSDFIRKAITAQLGLPCPLCSGRGFLARRDHDLFSPIVAGGRQVECAGCRQSLELPLDPDHLTSADRDRFDQFLHGGPLYCPACFDRAPPCGQCHWHIDPEQVAAHVQQAHPPEPE